MSGATEEQIEAAAKALAQKEPGSEWDDFDEREFFLRRARQALEAAFSADERHDAEEREAETEDHAATVTGEREKLIAEADGWVNADLVHRHAMSALDTIRRLRAALPAPVEVDAGQLSVVIHRAHQEWPEYSESRVNLGYAEYLAIVVTEWLRGEGQ